MWNRLIGTLSACVCLLALVPAPAADNPAPATPAGNLAADQLQAARKPALSLSDAQRQAVIDAVARQDTHQPTPKEFKAEVGAAVPRTVDLHAMPPQLAGEHPVLKDYMYARLDRNVAIVDALEKKVVALIPLPEQLTHDSAKKPDQKKAAEAAVGGLADLPPEQRRAIYQGASGEAQPVPAQAVLAGADVPAGMTFQPLPAGTAAQAPQLQGLHYARLQDGRLLLIDPQQRKVAGVITKDEGTRTAQDGGKEGAAGGSNTGTSGAPTADPIRERDESGKPSAYTGPSSRAPNN